MKKNINKSNSCEGKGVFKTMSEASDAAAAFNIRSPRKNRMTAYKCGYCSFYHFGHTAKRKDLKSVGKPKRDKKRLDPKEFKGLIENINEGYCVIKQIA